MWRQWGPMGLGEPTAIPGLQSPPHLKFIIHAVHIHGCLEAPCEQPLAEQLSAQPKFAAGCRPASSRSTRNFCR